MNNSFCQESAKLYSKNLQYYLKEDDVFDFSFDKTPIKTSDFAQNGKLLLTSKLYSSLSNYISQQQSNNYIQSSLQDNSTYNMCQKEFKTELKQKYKDLFKESMKQHPNILDKTSLEMLSELSTLHQNTERIESFRDEDKLNFQCEFIIDNLSNSKIDEIELDTDEEGSYYNDMDGIMYFINQNNHKQFDTSYLSITLQTVWDYDTVTKDRTELTDHLNAFKKEIFYVYHTNLAHLKKDQIQFNCD